MAWCDSILYLNILNCVKIFYIIPIKEKKKSENVIYNQILL